MDELSAFKDANIEVHGKTFKLHEFFGNSETVDYKKLQEIFYRHEPHFGQMTFILANDTIPPKPTFYVSRLLSNRIKIDMSIFKKPWPDVFVFKNRIEQHNLLQMARPDLLVLSSPQPAHLTSRFIYLDKHENWNSLKTSAAATSVPIHLINYDADQKIFLLEDTSTPSLIRRKFGSQNEQFYMSEDEFVKQQLSEEISASGACICDTSGMDKTFLLANIARLMTGKSTRRIIVFMPLTTFATKISTRSPNSKCYHETALIAILEQTSPQNLHLLLELIHEKHLALEIFFDGFDEVPSNEIELMKQVFLSIKQNLPQVRIYITSLPQMRRALEQSLHVVAYDLLPIDRQDQIDFLTKFWSKKENCFDQESLHLYATGCLEKVHMLLKKNEKEIAGIPLLCQLIPEVYVNGAIRTAKRRRTEISRNLSQMYEEFIEQRINHVANTREEFEYIELVHIWHALKLHFLVDFYKKNNQFNNVSSWSMFDELKRIGIMQMHSNETLVFTHRTFADYLAVHYLVPKLLDEETDFDTNIMLTFLLKSHKEKRNPKIEDDYDYNFQHPGIAYFLNSALNGVVLPETLVHTVKRYVNSISPKTFIQILCTCIQQNFCQIFSLLKEALKKIENNRLQEYFTTENAFELLLVCIRQPSSQPFSSCIQLFTEVQNIDIVSIAEFKERTVIKLAVECLNYEAVKYFLENFPHLLNEISALKIFVKFSYGNELDIEKREKMLLLLLSKNPILVNETDHILACKSIHLRLLKILVRFGGNLSAVNGKKTMKNCAMQAAKYMSSKDYQEFVEFLLTNYNADYLFLKNTKWADPLPKIVKWGVLLPDTLELLLNIPGIEVNMKNINLNNLAFLAVKGNKLKTLERLVLHELNPHDKGTHNRSLLHAAAYHGDKDMVNYLLSLGLHPNSRTNIGATPLHYAVNNTKNLSIVNVLVDKGADIQAKNNKNQNLLHSIAIYAKEYNEEILGYLIENNVGVNDCDKDGNTPLHLCWLHEEVKNYLIVNHADVDAKNKMGETPAEKHKHDAAIDPEQNIL